MLDHSAKRAILEKILNSTAFDRTDKYSSLLTYLVESTLCGKIPKEYTIAVDVFEKDKDFNPSVDTIVRYHMYHLRKKIDEYYENEGRNDKTKLVIPKGHYEVKFVTGAEDRPRFWHKLKRKDWIVITVLLLACFLTLFFYLRYLSLSNISRIIDRPIASDDPLWSSFFENKLPTLLIIGDHLLMREFDNDARGFREEYIYSIVTMEDLRNFNKRNPQRTLEKLDHGSLPHNSIFNVHCIEHVFYCFNQLPSIQFTSEYLSRPTDLPKIVDRNLIYMGGFNDLRQLNQILTKLPLEYRYTDTYRGNIIFRDTKTDSLLTLQCNKLDGERYIDLGLIAKIPGSNLENYLFLIGFAYPAQIEIVRMVSRMEMLTKLYKQIGLPKQAFPRYFFLVAEFVSSEYTAQEINIKYFHAIQKN